MAHITKIEDARTGQWLRHLDPVEDPITRIDYGWTMGDWNQLDVGLETVALREFDCNKSRIRQGPDTDSRSRRQIGVNGTTG